MTGLLKITVGDLLDQVASKFPGNEALIDLSKGEKYSYREFQRLVNQMAKGFLKLGLKKGDHIALWSPNRWEWIVSEFAVAKIGAVLVSVDTNIQLQGLEYLLRQSDSKGLILKEGSRGSEYIEMIRKLCPELNNSRPGQLNSSSLPELKHLILISDRSHPGMFLWGEILEMGEEVSEQELTGRQRSIRHDDVVTLLYTSGTTGVPKGVVSTHFGIINTSVASAEIQKLTERDRLCLSMPLAHMFGCVCITLAGISKGSALVIPSETFDPQKVLEAIEKERCTGIYGSPSSSISLM